ncbi:hypothetical protein RhiirA5_434334 [Rhizophagus irregularis]|uniref:Uncharacterized protein n=1 Tax=Rhizophagus irregularis TaxID=588596 RepID=A0A2N0NQ79_9GLOM|nr:hypothetical protein RhiirA5_434334 [Rhizophagus irregularis]
MAPDVNFEGPGCQRMAPDIYFKGPGCQRMALDFTLKLKEAETEFRASISKLKKADYKPDFHIEAENEFWTSILKLKEAENEFWTSISKEHGTPDSWTEFRSFGTSKVSETDKG